MNVAAFCLLPDMDLKQSLVDYCTKNQIGAACMMSCVGSLQCANIRYADCAQGTVIEGKLEILSLAGTLSQHGCHLHISVSDGHGHVVGGHLMPGSIIYTTAEIVLGILPEITFNRAMDVTTGYKELQIMATRLD